MDESRRQTRTFSTEDGKLQLEKSVNDRFEAANVVVENGESDQVEIGNEIKNGQFEVDHVINGKNDPANSARMVSILTENDNNDQVKIATFPDENISANKPDKMPPFPTRKNTDDQLQREYDLLRRMFDEWQIVHERNTWEDGGDVNGTKLKDLQRSLVEQHRLVQNLCTNAHNGVVGNSTEKNRNEKSFEKTADVLRGAKKLTGGYSNDVHCQKMSGMGNSVNLSKQQQQKQQKNVQQICFVMPKSERVEPIFKREFPPFTETSIVSTDVVKPSILLEQKRDNSSKTWSSTKSIVYDDNRDFSANTMTAVAVAEGDEFDFSHSDIDELIPDGNGGFVWPELRKIVKSGIQKTTIPDRNYSIVERFKGNALRPVENAKFPTNNGSVHKMTGKILEKPSQKTASLLIDAATLVAQMAQVKLKPISERKLKVDAFPNCDTSGTIKLMREIRESGGISKLRKIPAGKMSDSDEAKNASPEMEEQRNGESHEEARSESRSPSPKRNQKRHRSRSASYEKPKRRERKSRSRSRTYSPERRSGRHRSDDRDRSPRRDRNRDRGYGNSYGRRSDKMEGNPNPNRCLGVFGMSQYTTERQLRDFFGRFGPIERVQLVYDRPAGQSRGFGFIYFDTIEDAIEAKERCEDIELDGRRVRVDYSLTKRGHSPTPGQYMGSRYNSYDDRNHRRSPSPRGYYNEGRSRYSSSYY